MMIERRPNNFNPLVQKIKIRQLTLPDFTGLIWKEIVDLTDVLLWALGTNGLNGHC